MLDRLKLKYKRLTKRNFLKGKFAMKKRKRKGSNNGSGNVNIDKAKSKL